MDKHAARVLDFPRVLELLAESAQTPQGGDLCREVRSASSAMKTRELLLEVADFTELVDELGAPPLAGLKRKLSPFGLTARMPSSVITSSVPFTGFRPGPSCPESPPLNAA